MKFKTSIVISKDLPKEHLPIVYDNLKLQINKTINEWLFKNSLIPHRYGDYIYRRVDNDKANDLFEYLSEKPHTETIILERTIYFKCH